MHNNIKEIQDDEIDLKDLIKTIWDQRIFIVLFTLSITIASMIYALLIPPTYGAKAIIKIGEYKVDNNSNIQLDNASSLVEELKVLYIDLLRNDKNKLAYIKNIKMLNSQKSFISIKSEAISNTDAINEINQIINYIQNKHNIILEDIKLKRETQINNLKKRIMLIKTRDVVQLEEKIKSYTNNINFYIESLDTLLENISKIKNKTPTLTILELNEQRHLKEMISKLRSDIAVLEDKRFNLEQITIQELNEEIINIKTLMLPHNNKKSEVVGKIITNDYPIKPKKQLIVLVSLVSGFILSIFLVFFMNFIRSKLITSYLCEKNLNTNQ